MGQKDCGPIPACANWPVTGRLNLPAGAGEGTQVVACHDTACATVTLPAPAANGFVTELLFSSPDTAGTLTTRSDGSLQVAVGWFVGEDGDRYTVVARDSAGVELGSIGVNAVFPPETTSNGCPNYCASVTFGDQL